MATYCLSITLKFSKNVLLFIYLAVGELRQVFMERKEDLL